MNFNTQPPTTTETQLAWVKRQLLEHGRVSRNQALERYCSRLGARIQDLRDAGWNIEGRWEKYQYGKDYVYYVRPKETLF